MWLLSQGDGSKHRSAPVHVRGSPHRPVQPLDVDGYGWSGYDEAAQQLHDEVDRPQQDGSHLHKIGDSLISSPFITHTAGGATVKQLPACSLGVIAIVSTPKFVMY